MKINYFVPICIFCIVSAMAQEQMKDSIQSEALGELVLTGQFEPQSIKKSVFDVTRITRADIERQAANNLSDLLNQYLNITIAPESGTGRSTVSMFGLDGRYFKILVDNIPLVTDNAFGSNADLTQINLDDVQQIEIIEGSMGVTHGGNSVTGILNIITKKSAKHVWEISATVQEETVGTEYAAFNKGRHIQNVKISHTFSDHWFASFNLSRNDFDGFLDDRKGKDYDNTDLKRGYEWLPKQQYLGSGMLSYRDGNFRAFYKFDYLDENIDYYNQAVLVTPNPPFGEIRYAMDKRYGTNRIYNHLNVTGKIAQLDYNVSASYQKQTRDTEDFDYDLQTHQESNRTTTRNQSAEVWYSTGTLSNFFKDKKADLQLGYELTSNLGMALVDGENQTLVLVRERLSNYDFFLSAEIRATEKFSLRPGIRYSFQDEFDNQYATSLGLRYLFNNGIELRGSLGKSFRTPDFDEMFSNIRFSGHIFLGNENLVPENSTSYDISIKKNTTLASGLKLYGDWSAGWLDIGDKIDMAFVGFDANADPVYQFINISSYQMLNIATTHQFEYKKWSLTAGASWVGISQKIDNGETVSDDRFLFSLQLNGNVSYNWEKYATVFSVYYKFNGRQRQFAKTVENGESAFRLSEIGSYGFLDASVKKSFYKNRFEFTAGARNIMDVTRINQGIASGAHATSSDILLGYGRSYFVKLTYNLNL